MYEDGRLTEVIDNLSGNLNNKLENYNNEIIKIVTPLEEITQNTQIDIENIENNKINYFITPEMFGAKGDGVTDDTIPLENMIEYAKNTKNTRIVSEKKKVYCTIRPLNIGAFQYFDFGNATIKAIAYMDYVIKIDTSNNRGGIVRGIIIDCNNLANQGIYIQYSRLFHIKEIQIYRFNSYGIYLKQGNVIARDIYIDKDITPMTTIKNATGIYTNGTDSKFYSISIKDCHIGIYNDNGINYYTNVHSWLIDTTIIKDSICFFIQGSAILSNCYTDTYYIAIKNDNTQLLTINGLHAYLNPNYYTVSNVGDNEPYIFYLTQDSNNIEQYPSSASKIKIKGLSVDYPITEFTNKPKFSNVSGNDFIEKNKDYNIIYSNYFDVSKFDNVPPPYYSSELTSINSNFVVESNKIIKNGCIVTLDLNLRVVEKSLLTNEQFTIASIPFGFYPLNSFYTVCYFGTDSGTNFITCPVFVQSSTTGGRNIKVLIPNTFTENVNANRLRFHITYVTE